MPASHNHPKWVLVAATHAELPIDWLKCQNIPVLTRKGLMSGNAHRYDFKLAIAIVISGVGPENASATATWIRQNWAPDIVLNIGAAGSTIPSFPPGTWIFPTHIQAASNTLQIANCQQIAFCNTLPAKPYPQLTTYPSAVTTPPTTPEIVDMEAFYLAAPFEATPNTFQCLKYVTDTCSSATQNDFQDNLAKMRADIQHFLKSFLTPTKNVSVIIPTYNRAHTLKTCIDSVLGQTLPPNQIIVVNDGSTDTTHTLLAKYTAQYPMLSIIESKQNKGVSWARNTGIEASQSDWIALLDSDDYWTENKLEDQFQYLDRYPHYAIMQSEEIWVRNNKRVNACAHHKKVEGWIFDQCLERCLISPSSVLIHRSILPQQPFDETLPACEDYDLWLQLTAKFPVGLSATQSLIKTGGHADQLSQKYPIMDRFRIKSLQNALQNEACPEIKDKIANVLFRKLNIIIRGAHKRGRLPQFQPLSSPSELHQLDIDQLHNHLATV